MTMNLSIFLLSVKRSEIMLEKHLQKLVKVTILYIKEKLLH